MDRLDSRTLAALGLGLALMISGCKSTGTDVPPGRPFAATGPQSLESPPVSFSTEQAPAQTPVPSGVSTDTPPPSLYGAQAPGASGAAPPGVN